MIPVLQEYAVDDVSGRRGDCVRAVIASLLELPLSDVPHFVQEHADGGRDWWSHIGEWLAARRLALYLVDPDVERLAPRPGEFYWASGPSPRGYLGNGVARALHAVVYRDEQLAHDPHPDGGGIVFVNERWAIREQPGGAAGS